MANNTAAKARQRKGMTAAPSFFSEGSPVGVITPTAKGDLCVDTLTPALYQATGTEPSDWTQVGGGLSIVTAAVAAKNPLGTGITLLATLTFTETGIYIVQGVLPVVTVGTHAFHITITASTGTATWTKTPSEFPTTVIFPAGTATSVPLLAKWQITKVGTVELKAFAHTATTCAITLFGILIATKVADLP